MASTLVLIRHGETDWSRAGRHTGSTDVPLTAEGERQARALGSVLHPDRFALVLTSPRQRARATAALAGLTHAQVDDDLAEWDYGGYEGLTSEEISTRLGRPWTLFGDGVPAGTTPGESIEEVAARAERVLVRVGPVTAAGGDVALVGHGHLLRVLAARWLGLPPRTAALLALRAGSISRLGYEHAVPVIELWNARPAEV